MNFISQLKQRLQRTALYYWIEPTLWTLIRHPNLFLLKSKGVVHIGAHLAEEKDVYRRYGVDVVWVEADPGLFEGLNTSLQGYPRQKAIRELISDHDDEVVTFHVSSNGGASSSVLNLADHKKLWPDVHFVRSLNLTTLTLPSLMEKYQIDISGYDALALDTQGTELKILKGAQSLLSQFKFIQAEVADFPVYEGCCVLSEMDEFLFANGFRRIVLWKFAGQAGVGSCFEVLYAR